jgi:hypothetical protein
MVSNSNKSDNFAAKSVSCNGQRRETTNKHRKIDEIELETGWALTLFQYQLRRVATSADHLRTS